MCGWMALPVASVVLAAVKGAALAKSDEVAGGQLGVVHVGLGQAVEELAVEVEPVTPGGRSPEPGCRCWCRGCRRPASGCSATRVTPLSGVVRSPGFGPVIVGLVVLLEGRAALFEGHVEAVELEAHAAAVVIGAVAEQV